MTCINRFRALLFCSSPLFCLSLALLVSCADYQVTLNERTIYQPPPLLQDYVIADEGLRRCIEQHIRDERISQAEQLVRLLCSYADISSLSGLETFVALRELNVSYNKLVDLAPLATLSQLEQLSVKHNQLNDVDALRGLRHLHRLDLSENPSLQCQHLDAVLENIPSAAMVLVPEQCAE